MFRVKIHLGKGLYFGWFQIKSLKTGETAYVCPEAESLKLSDCILKNRRKTADRIHAGANREVCAWVQCAFFEVIQKGAAIDLITDETSKVSYNPKKRPFFCDENGRNIDGFRYETIVSYGRDLFAV